MGVHTIRRHAPHRACRRRGPCWARLQDSHACSQCAVTSCCPRLGCHASPVAALKPSPHAGSPAGRSSVASANCQPACSDPCNSADKADRGIDLSVCDTFYPTGTLHRRKGRGDGDRSCNMSRPPPSLLRPPLIAAGWGGGRIWGLSQGRLLPLKAPTTPPLGG